MLSMQGGIRNGEVGKKNLMCAQLLIGRFRNIVLLIEGRGKPNKNLHPTPLGGAGEAHR